MQIKYKKYYMLIIDGNMLAHRTFHKMDFLENSQGVHTGMEFGFLRSVESLQKKYPDQKIIICFDTIYNKKRKFCKRYKANREPMKENNFYPRLKELQLFLNNFWDLAWMYGEEADDVMYSISCKAEEVVYLLSNDNDLLQCIGDSVFVLKSHESFIYTWDTERVKEKYYVDPEWLVMFRSFVGDKTDNLDGVPRIQKRILADAIYNGINDNEEVFPHCMAKNIANYTGWSTKMAIAIKNFYENGLWQENYNLMLLREVDYEYHEAKIDETYIEAKLLFWEINSLEMCKGRIKYSETEF